MTDDDRQGARALLLFLLACGWAWLLYLRFSNPDMTTTRFFLSYWPLYLPLGLGMALYVFLRSR